MAQALRTNSSAVATHHPLGAQAAKEILIDGGNAVDAAVAALTTLCVVLPSQVGLGGFGGSMVLHLAQSGKTVAIDFDSVSPIGFKEDLFADDPANRSSYGYLATTVPGIVAGLALALQNFGTRSWKQATAFATNLAENGFPMEAEHRAHMEIWKSAADPVSLHALLPDGVIPELGQIWKQKDLADLFRKLGDEGPEAFYQGEIPRKIAQQIRANGGILSEKDFSTYRARLVEPLSINYRGHTVLTPPPPSAGVTTLEMLKTLEQFEIKAMEKWGAPYLHLVAETAKLCWIDRHRCLGDPDFVTMPIEELLSTASAATRATELRRQSLHPGAPSPINTGPHTSNVSVIDREGNIISLTATQGYQYGSRVVIDGLGLVMGQGMSRFDFKPDHPNRPVPGKRMHHNMAPTILLNSGKPFAAIGLPGGPKIVTVTAQLVVNLIDFHCSAAETVSAPRIHAEVGRDVGVSKSLPMETVNALKAMGHHIERGQSVGGPPHEIASYANAVLADEKGALSAASGAGVDASCVI